MSAVSGSPPAATPTKGRARGAAGWRTAAWCVGFLLLLELVTRRWIVDRATGPTASENAALSAAVDQASREAKKAGVPLQVVFIGASHTQAAVASREIERILSLPAGSVLNAGLSNARPRDMLAFYDAHRDQFRGAKLVYVATGISYLNRNGLNRRRTPAPAWRRRSTKEDRLSFPADLTTRIDLMVGWLWKTWDQRTTWKTELRRRLVSLGSRGRSGKAPSVYDDLGRPGLGAEKVKMTPELFEREIADTVDRHLFHYEIDAEGVRSLRQLLAQIREDGAIPVLVEFPLPPQYLDSVYVRHPMTLQRYAKALKDDVGEVDRIDSVGRGVTLGLEDFRDADHLTKAGAARVAPWLATDVGVRGVGSLPPELRPAQSAPLQIPLHGMFGQR